VTEKLTTKTFMEAVKPFVGQEGVEIVICQGWSVYNGIRGSTTYTLPGQVRVERAAQRSWLLGTIGGKTMDALRRRNMLVRDEERTWTHSDPLGYRETYWKVIL